MTRKYYTLCERTPGQLWTPEFGDYDKKVVEQEQRDCSRTPGTKFKIITTDGAQKSINEAVDALNESVRSAASRLQERKLPASDRPKAIYEYVVAGESSFPLDMLRYDSCWFADQESVNYADAKGQRKLAMRSYERPTEARWNSFGWRIVSRY